MEHPQTDKNKTLCHLLFFRDTRPHDSSECSRFTHSFIHSFIHRVGPNTSGYSYFLDLDLDLDLNLSMIDLDVRGDELEEP